MTNTTIYLKNPKVRIAYGKSGKRVFLQYLQRLSQRLYRWHMNWRTRRQMIHLDSYQLSDIGISLGEAMEEAAKPFWRD